MGFGLKAALACQLDMKALSAFKKKVTSPTPALAPQLGLLGSPPDPVGRFTMREGPSL